MFIANRLVPQHKQFLDEHGYEFREYPEHEFERRLSQCVARTPEVSLDTCRRGRRLEFWRHHLNFFMRSRNSR